MPHQALNSSRVPRPTSVSPEVSSPSPDTDLLMAMENCPHPSREQLRLVSAILRAPLGTTIPAPADINLNMDWPILSGYSNGQMNWIIHPENSNFEFAIRFKIGLPDYDDVPASPPEYWPSSPDVLWGQIVNERDPRERDVLRTEWLDRFPYFQGPPPDEVDIQNLQYVNEDEVPDMATDSGRDTDDENESEDGGSSADFYRNTDSDDVEIAGDDEVGDNISSGNEASINVVSDNPVHELSDHYAGDDEAGEGDRVESDSTSVENNAFENDIDNIDNWSDRDPNIDVYGDIDVYLYGSNAADEPVPDSESEYLIDLAEPNDEDPIRLTPEQMAQLNTPQDGRELRRFSDLGLDEETSRARAGELYVVSADGNRIYHRGRIYVRGPLPRHLIGWCPIVEDGVFDFYIRENVGLIVRNGLVFARVLPPPAPVNGTLLDTDNERMLDPGLCDFFGDYYQEQDLFVIDGLVYARNPTPIR